MFIKDFLDSFSKCLGSRGGFDECTHSVLDKKSRNNSWVDVNNDSWMNEIDQEIDIRQRRNVKGRKYSNREAMNYNDQNHVDKNTSRSKTLYHDRLSKDMSKASLKKIRQDSNRMVKEKGICKHHKFSHIFRMKNNNYSFQPPPKEVVKKSYTDDTEDDTSVDISVTKNPPVPLFTKHNVLSSGNTKNSLLLFLASGSHRTVAKECSLESSSNYRFLRRRANDK